MIRSNNGGHLFFPQDGNQYTNLEQLRYFSYRKLNYFWHSNEMYFGNVGDLDGIVFFFYLKFIKLFNIIDSIVTVSSNVSYRNRFNIR